MTFTAAILVCVLLSLLFFVASVRRLRRRRVLGGMAHGTTGLVLLLVAVAAVLVASNLRTYQRLTYEQPAGELQFTRTGEREYNAVLTYPTGTKSSFALRGDEWQVDARVLKWTAFANLIGFDAAYRLERISGRYTKIEEEQSQPRTVYALESPGRVDPWELIRSHHGWIPWVDALYGSATFLPMADGALYEIKVSQTGLIARPLNQAAREVSGNWHT